MEANPGNRTDNVVRIQYNLDMTIGNIRRANGMIEKTPDHKTKQVLKAKNERGMDVLDGMRREIRDEANAAKNSWLP